MRFQTTLSWVCVSGWLAAAPVSAQEAPPANGDCQACHAEPSMTRTDGTPVVVPSEVFGQSVHGFLSCVDCHADLATLTEFPHPEQLAVVDCATCHDDAATKVAVSVHATVRDAAGAAVTCAACHGPAHQMLPSSDLQSPTHTLRVATTCAACHGETAPAGTPAAAQVAAAFADSIHGRALTRSGNVAAPTCSNCHRSHDVLPAGDPMSPVHRMVVPATCGTCHAGIQNEFADSAHGAGLLAGGASEPHCASCHTAHGVQRTEGDVWQLSAVEQCGTCHREALATYRDTFHGQVTALGFTPVAKCVDCHQAHRIFGQGDERSSVAPENLVTTCRTCHANANHNFVQYQPHANKDDVERLPALYYAARFMNLLLVGTFTFFGLHSTLWFLRERTGARGRTDT